MGIEIIRIVKTNNCNSYTKSFQIFNYEQSIKQ